MAHVLRSFADPADADHSIHHRTGDELVASLGHIQESPSEAGTVDMIVRRPTVGERQELGEAVFTTAAGLVGDSWIDRPSRRTLDGGPHPEMQLNIMNSRVIDAIAGGAERWSLAGDQLFVDLDLSLANLPAGTRLSLGSAVIEITAEPHTGCAKFARRFGLAARKFVNDDDVATWRLRGINAKVVTDGRVRPGDRIAKVCAATAAD